MELQNKFTCKNQYGYTIKDLYIDFDKKQFKTGNLFFGGAKKLNKKTMDGLIEQLKKANFEEVQEND